MVSPLVFHRLDTVPAPPSDTGTGAADRALVAAVTAAHTPPVPGPGVGLVVAWDRLGESDRRIRVLVGGPADSPITTLTPTGGSGGGGVVMFPPGAIGVSVDATQVWRQWERLPVWVACTGVADALVAGPAEQSGRGSVFEEVFTYLPGPVCWLVTATPVPDSEIEDEIAGLEVELPRQRARGDSEPERIAVARNESRFRELSSARAAGLWRIRVAVGGRDEASVRAAAGFLCAAADLDDLPYRVAPVAGSAGPAQHVLAVARTAGFVAGARVVARLARAPRREVPGVRVIETPQFDVAPEHRGGGFDLGAVLDASGAPVDRFTLAEATVARHGLVVGATGAGKSQTVQHLLEQLHERQVAWLVIEPAKAEYAFMAGRTGSPVTVIRPGAAELVPAGYNPLEPEPGFPLQTHLDLVASLFLAAFDAVEPFPQVLSHALARCYRDLGWDLVLGTPARAGHQPRYPSLGDLQAAAVEVVESIGYGPEVAANVRGFIDVRIGSLRLGTPGRFFAGYRLDTAELLRRDVVMEIEDLGHDADKAFLMGVVLIRITEYLRVHRHSRAGTGVGHVTVIEEAHRLLRRAEPGTPAAHAVAIFTAMLAEIRASGEAIIVAEQIPSKITPDLLKNTAYKIVHRLPAAEDRDMIGATVNLDAAGSRQVTALPAGRAIVHTDGMDRPIRIQTPYCASREIRLPSPPPPVTSTGRPALILRDLHRAHLLAEDPRLMIWIELVVLAHLIGRPPPLPDPHWLRAWTDQADAPIIDEAIHHRIDAALGPRYAGLAAYYPPEDLTEHLHEYLTTVRNGEPPGCDGGETRWQAGRYRWADVQAALHNTTGGSGAAHPDTAVWARRGLSLPGASLAEQRAALAIHPDSWADPRIVLGPAPGVLAECLDRLTGPAATEQRLHQATRHLRGLTQWPLVFLDPNTGEGRRS